MFLILGARTPFDCTYARLHSKGRSPERGRKGEGEEENREEENGVREIGRRERVGKRASVVVRVEKARVVMIM